MLHVMAVIRFHPEHADAVSDALATLAVSSRSEAGCVRYEVFRRAGEAVLVTQETWVSKEAEQAHMAGPNLAAAFAAVGAFLTAPPEIHHYMQIA